MSAERYGSLTAVLAHTERLLATRPNEAAEQAEEILRAAPGHPEGVILLACAKRALGETQDALAIFHELTSQRADSARAYLEFGRTLLEAGEADQAILSLRRAVHLEPFQPDGWRTLAEALERQGSAQEALDARARLSVAEREMADLASASTALRLGDFAAAERAVRSHLARKPTDPDGLRILAEIGVRIGRMQDAERFYRSSLKHAPDLVAARHGLAVLLHRMGRSQEALAELEHMLAADPANQGLSNLKATLLASIGEYDGVISTYAEGLRTHPIQPRGWLSYGHALKTVGRIPECVEAYRKAIQQKPSLGEAYWSLANLKTFRFEADEVAAMREAITQPNVGEADKVHLYYSLGKALEDAKDFAGAFQAYADGARLRRGQIRYDAAETSGHVHASRELFTADYFHRRAGQGASHADPIFVVGLPRAGSTLIEQILASHSQVEGTMELPDINTIAQMIGARRRPTDISKYPSALGAMTPQDVRRFGDLYMERTRIQRKTAKPYFVDKMPNNFQHVGLILTILPNAKIIDARRHPMGNCFSAFKQHFARGHNFSYDLNELGRYYYDYIALMAHFDKAAPGRVHRVIYERMVSDTENEIRALLDYCGLPFEPACLSFYANDRAVRTPSAEQVRQPIFTSALEQWRSFEPWLGPLKSALGPVLDAYPDAPSDM